MIDVKRFGYLLMLGLGIGVMLVYLRTGHMRTVYRLTQMSVEERQLAGQVLEQQVALSARVENPTVVRAQVARLGIRVCRAGQELEEEAGPMTARAGEWHEMQGAGVGEVSWQ